MQLWEAYARFRYLPRLASRSVLDVAISTQRTIRENAKQLGA